jgi:peptide/nickel transport system permease protein
MLSNQHRMSRYIVRRLFASVPALLGVTLITFLLMHATAGSFLPGLELNPNLRPEDIQRIRQNLGLNDPLPVQYWRWLTGLLHGDFGNSILDGRPVIGAILDRLPNTLLLTGAALLIGVGISLPFGVVGAVRRGWTDNILTLLSVLGISLPGFWLGLLLILVFSITFNRLGWPWLPSGGATSAVGGGDLIDRLEHLILPAITLAFIDLAIWSRFTRSSMLEALSQEYIRTARAKGLAEGRVLYAHALRNAVLPLVTLLGLELPSLVGGGAIIEVVFSWPGIGRLALETALQYDFTMVLGLTTFTGMLVIGGSLLADLLFAALDPRIRYR